MLSPRIIPALLLIDNEVVITEKFKNPIYVGDPINIIKILNEKEVDEIIVLDIRATKSGRAPNYKLVEILADECRMPIAYGGGVSSFDHASNILSLGIEKVCVSSLFHNNPREVSRISECFGAQSTVVVMDIKKSFFSKNYNCVSLVGSKIVSNDIASIAKKAVEVGAGELILNSLDRDGTRKGFDLDLIDIVRKLVSIQLTVLGGAGCIDDFRKVCRSFGIIGVAAGSYFALKGVHNAVLINYLSQEEKRFVFSK